MNLYTWMDSLQRFQAVPLVTVVCEPVYKEGEIKANGDYCLPGPCFLQHLKSVSNVLMTWLV